MSLRYARGAAGRQRSDATGRLPVARGPTMGPEKGHGHHLGFGGGPLVIGLVAAAGGIPVAFGVGAAAHASCRSRAVSARRSMRRPAALTAPEPADA